MYLRGNELDIVYFIDMKMELVRTKQNQNVLYVYCTLVMPIAYIPWFFFFFFFFCIDI